MITYYVCFRTDKELTVFAEQMSFGVNAISFFVGEKLTCLINLDCVRYVENASIRLTKTTKKD